MGLLTHARLTPGATLTTLSGAVVTIHSWRGEGSYANVYRALLGPSRRACALKVPKAEIPDAALYLEREREVLARLRHPHVVCLLDAAEWSERPVSVLEWLDGETLRELLAARKRLPLRQTLDLLTGIADGLAHIHGRGLVHGDVREQNVLVLKERGAVLTDPLGTGDAAADVRTAGALLHRMLTGEHPSPGALRLTPAAGYNPSIVRLWEQTQADPPLPAAALLEQARRLRAAI